MNDIGQVALPISTGTERQSRRKNPSQCQCSKSQFCIEGISGSVVEFLPATRVGFPADAKLLLHKKVYNDEHKRTLKG